MSKKKIIAMIISVVMVFSLIPTAVFAIQVDEWVTGQGYGSITPNSDGTYTFQGDSELNTDNSHSGPYTKANAASLADGEIVESVDVFINPNTMNVAEKFALTSSLNDVNDNYLTEFLVNFWKDNTNGISVSAGLDSNFSAQLTEAGLYTFKYSYIPGETMVFGNFSILKDGVEIASTNDILLPGTSLDVAKGRRAVWFVDISVANGLQVYSITDADYTKVDEAIAKANALNRDEYKDFSGVDAAVNAVVRGKNITQQAEVDAMAQAIEEAIAALEKKEETPVNPAEPTEPTTPGASGTIDGSTEQEMNSPQTGDNSNTVMWIAVAVLAAGAMTGTVFFARKKKAE